MKITVRTSGLLDRYLPQGAQDGTAAIEIAEGATVADVMARLGMPGDGKYLVIANDATVREAERAAHVLADGDTLAIVPPLKGG
ncbi:MAG: MoaD/ThiS family protein [Alphaproteobacteria bacterium]